MKSLYFVGNAELWNDAWFLALVESLKSRALSIILLDHQKDTLDIKQTAEKLSVYERMIFHKNVNVEETLARSGVVLTEAKKSLIYIFADIENPQANPKQVAWGVDEIELLKTVSLWEGSQVIEDAFLFDMNLAGEVSRAIQKNEDSLIDANLLMADADELSQLIDNSKTKILEIQGATRIESPAVVESVAPIVPVDGIEFPELEAKNTQIIKPVEVDESDFSIERSVAPLPPEELSSQDFAEESIRPGVPSVEVSQLISAMSPSVSGEDMEVLKRYSNIKERELRESQAATEALRRQIRYFDERLKKSEEERRRLLMRLEESDNELRTTVDKKDENRAQLRSIESRYEEKIKELLIQLESSQFQAGKLDKKLTDFRERVRNDLQKIRSRERELASRLEIQKRDAEALLSAKDERLLNQKREMDRLEFDLDSLKERLMDDAHKGEERRKRVARALQSLKLAQSILSGLEEDALTKDDKDKAA